jgi:hypothetical protein
VTGKKDHELEKYLGGQSPLSRAYRAGRDEEPPELLDARIRREARDALKREPATRPWLNRWVPLAAAAVIVMSVSLLVFRFERAEPPVPAGGDVAAVPAEEKSARVAMTPARPAPAPAPFPADRAGSRLKKELRDVPAAPAPVTAESAAPRPASKPGEPPAASPAPEKLKADNAGVVSPTRMQAVGAAAPEAQRFRRAEEARQAVRAPPAHADVAGVTVSGEAGAYRFNVTIRSPDKGCAQYANWWEVVSEDGRLLYRRVLLHSHVDEQPFTRDGGPVPVAADTIVWVRAHQHPQGYGGVAFRGSVRTGFRAAVPPAGFAAALAKTPPLPAGCDF